MVVRMRRNRSQTAKRRSHHGLSTSRVTTDKQGNTHLRHRVNPETGMYRGKMIIDVVAQKKREQRRLKKKETELRAAGRETEKETA